MKRWILLLSVLAGGLLVTGGLVAWQLTGRVKSQPQMAAPTATPTPQPTANQISGLVIPHHDLVKTQRAELLRTVAGKIAAPATVIVISPNHYEVGNGAIQTTDREWKLSEGKLLPNRAVIQTVVAAGVRNEDSSFEGEHGIRLVLSDIRKNFPDAQIVPLIFKRGTDATQLESLQAALQQSCRECLVIASVDFSHYQTAQLADLHDRLTRRALRELDSEALRNKAEVDAPAALAFLAGWAKLQNTERFVEQDHTNSGVLLKDADMETTTHFFGWYERGEPVPAESSVSFTLAGDIMLDRAVSHVYLSGGLSKVFAGIGERLFWGTDAGVANLEGPISAVPTTDDISPNNLVFNFPPQTIEALKYAKLNGVSLANNHSLNAGSQGLATTRRLLEGAKLQSIGGPGNADVTKVGRFEGKDMTLYIIGVHTLSSVPDLTNQIKELKKDAQNRVIVFPHWGIEYKAKHSSSQEQQAHSWIDAGADAVIGAHPHVIQDAEAYKGKPIFYSMGNFVFDQEFSVPTQQGLVISGEFSKDGLTVFATPVQLKKYRPYIMRGSSKQAVLDTLYAGLKSYEQAGEAGTRVFHFP